MSAPAEGRDAAATPAGDLSPRLVRGLLVGITLLALLLRSVRLGSDLWLDEIAPFLAYHGRSLLSILGDYGAPNNHLLNTVLVNASAALFGPREWAIRLPAMLAGVATVPLVYRAGRLAFDRGTSLAAALLLAVSYHHVFFSQDARGYAAYLLFSLAATILLVRGLRGSRTAWHLYPAAMILACAALPLAVVVLASHVLVGGMEAVRRRRATGTWPAGVVRSGAVACGVAIVGVALLYAPVLAQVVREIGARYAQARIGYAPLSRAFGAELVRGVAAGFAGGRVVAGVLLLAIGLVGSVVLWRRCRPLAVGLLLPPAATLVALAVTGSTLYPRFLLLWLLFAVLAAAAGLMAVGRRLGHLLVPVSPRAPQRVAAVLVLVAATASLAALPRYYRVPKQPYRASLAYLRATLPASAWVLALDISESGLRFYGPRYGWASGRNLYFARSEDRFRRLLAHAGDRPVAVVTTFDGTLPTRAPGLAAALAARWCRQRVFPAAVEDGEVRIWRRCPGRAPRASPRAGER